jgi:hypothetical protein
MGLARSRRRGEVVLLRIGIAPGRSWIGFDQLDFMVGAYAFVCLVYVPPPLATLLALPIVFVGSIACRHRRVAESERKRTLSLAAPAAHSLGK